ncbi:MAG: tRNA lysidine(34) synthetase TilS [candidate division NC10 bacterium]|nr:tRNA lysidine(34) synthetase TilS [candidate division NC10 bacterium]
MVLAMVRRALLRHGMVRADDTVLVAVSGGVDSVVLLDCLHRLAPRMGLSLRVAHLDHGLRGEEGAADAAFVREAAAARGLAVTVGHLPPGALEARGRSLQEAAREARYAFLAEAAKAAGAERIAVAHTADDVAETVLMNLLRGSGPAGLRGIPPVRGRRVIRPLLTVRRQQVEAYARARRLPFRPDPSNTDPRFLRNRIRQRLLPFLEKEFNPRVVESVARAAALLEDDHAYLEGEAARVPAAFPLEAGALRALPLPVRRRVLVRALRAALPKGSRVRLEHLQAVEALLDPGGDRGVVRLPGPLEARLREGRIVIAAAGQGVSDLPPPPLPLPGAGEVRWGSYRARIGPMEEAGEIAAGPAGAPKARWSVALDADRLQLPLTLRAWQPGDAYRPLGAPGRRKLQDLFTDARVPRERRGRLPVLADGRGVLWVPGFRPDGRAAATAATARVLTLEVWEESSGAA